MSNNNISNETQNLDIPEFLKTAIQQEPVNPGNGLSPAEREALKESLKIPPTEQPTQLDNELNLPILGELPTEVKTNVGRAAYLYRLYELYTGLHMKVMELSTAGDPDIIEAACLIDQGIQMVVNNINNRHAAG